MSTGNPYDQAQRPLADDPSFMASLSDLDDGLAGPAEPVRSRTRHEDALPVAPPAAAPPSAPQTFSVSRPQLPPIVTAPGRRPLLDLFPSEIDNAALAPFAPLAAEAPKAHASRASAKPRAAAPESAAGPATYETFYGLHERPFSLSSDPKVLYQSSEYDRVAQKMLGAIGTREPLVLLTGEIGMGKTLLCRALVEQLDRHTLTSFLSDPITSIDELLKTLLIDFGVVSRDDVARGRMASASQGELAAALREFLSSLAPLQAFAVVIVDEAQTIPSAVLHEIRHLVSTDNERLMQIILVGQPSLAAALEKIPSSGLADAVSLRLMLGPLANDEVGGYVLHRLRVAGTSPRVDFDDGATAALFAVSGGKPRLINLLCDRALSAGFSRSASVIDEELVNGAAEDLDMAPPASTTVRARVATVGVVVLALLAGAAAGALTFRGDIAAILAHWH